MKILYVVKSLEKGGAERYVLDLLTYLSDHTDIDFRLAVLYNVNLYDEYNVEKLNIVDLQYSTFSFRKKNKNERFNQLLDEFQPDIIHSHLFMAEFVTGLHTRPNIKYVCHCHDNMHQFHPLPFQKIFNKERLTSRLEYLMMSIKKYRKTSTHFIANSQHTFDFFKKNVPKSQRENIHLIYYGFNFSLYHQEKEIGTFEKIRLINVGNYWAKKNQTFLLEVAEVLKNRTINFEMNLIGDGPDFEMIKEKIQALGLEKHVLQRGRQSKVQDWYKESDLYIHAATYEPFGLVFLEAMASGLPVVTLDGKGNKDIIEQDKNGYLLHEQNAEKFANKIIEYTSDKHKYAQISKYAQEFAKQFDAPLKTKEMIAFYERLMKDTL